MHAPVETPLKRASVRTATCLPNGRYLSARRELIGLLHARAHRPAADQHEHVAGVNASRLDRGDRRRLGDEDLGRAGEAIHAVGIDHRRIDRRALDHRAFRREVADRGNRPSTSARARPPTSGDMITSSGSTPSRSREAAREARRGARTTPTRRAARRASCRSTVSTLVSSSPARRRCSITSGHAAGQEHLHGRMIARPVRQRVDEARHLPVDVGPVAAVGRRRPAACAIAGRCRIRFVDPPNAACDDHRVAQRGVGEDVAHRDAALLRAPSAPCAERRAMSSQIGWPDGASAEWPSDMPERFADDLRRRGRAEELAAAAGRRAGAAAEIGGFLERDLAVHEAHADRLHARRRPRPRSGSSVTPPGTSTHGRSWLRGQRHHHRRQPLVAGRDAEHAAPRRQRSDQPAEDRRRVVAVRQAVEHRRRALRPAVARIGARRRQTESRRPP